MDINGAVSLIENFVDSHRRRNPAFAPSEVQVRPSGDEIDTIKIWINYGAAQSAPFDPHETTAQFLDALTSAHPEVTRFTLETRSDAF